MALTTQQKRVYFQNTQKLLENDIWEKTVRSFKKDFVSLTPFYHNQRLYFQTKDWLNKSELVFKNIEFKPLITIQENTNKNCEDYNQFHLTRNKKTCSIVIGNELFGDLSQTNIEVRLNQSFGGYCAKYLDSDLYSCHIDKIDNTSNSLLITKILDYLKDFNYEQVYIIFQISDPARCFNRIWWDPLELILHDKNASLKEHLSYQFMPWGSIVEMYEKIKNIDFLKDSLFFTLGQKNKNGYPVITPTEFYAIYEWSIIDIINTQARSFKKFMKIKNVFWRDFYQPANNDLDVIQKSFIEFAKDSDLVLPFDSENGNFAKLIVDVAPERLTKELSRFYEKIPNLPKYVYSVIVEPSEVTELLFTDNSPTVYGEFDHKWLSECQNYTMVEKWTKFLLTNAGWLK